MMDWLLAVRDFFWQYQGQMIWGAVGVALFAILALLRKKITRVLLWLLAKMLFRARHHLRNDFVQALARPAEALLVLLGGCILMALLPLPVAVWAVVQLWLRVLTIALLTWTLCALIARPEFLFGRLAAKIDMRTNRTATDFISKIIRALVIAFGLVIIIGEFGYNVTGIITGLGLGGLTFALAAKDSAANLFGGFVIIFDKPFLVGDWITTPTVDGVVEEISFRSTRVRTFANSLIVVPNAVLANEAITNWSRMQKRRVTFTLGLAYHTDTQTLQAITTEIQSMIEATPGVHPETILVTFDAFSDSSLDLNVLFFTESIEWAAYMKVKESVNFRIKGIVEKHGASFAFPSRSVYLEKTN